MDDDKVVSLQQRIAQAQSNKPSRPVELNTTRIRDLSVKAVIYPQTILPSEAQELGAAILSHLKKYYPTIDK